jgi:hypothetical protein
METRFLQWGAGFVFSQCLQLDATGKGSLLEFRARVFLPVKKMTGARLFG